MRIVIAPDKFKHSLTSFEVCKAIEEGLKNASTDFQITSLPLSDGGDGLADVLCYYTSFQQITETVHDPLWRRIKARYLFSEKEKTAFIEMAQASGLHLLQPAEYNPNLTTTYGTGELIKYSLEKGAEKIIIGIGGSATNDCGIGMAAALGYRFLDESGRDLEPVGKNLSAIKTIEDSAIVDAKTIEVQVACDVSNYLTGDEGATKVYGPQKGATPETIENLEAGMQNFSELVKRKTGLDITTIKSGGAAGGMGAGCVLFLGAEIISGAELILQYSNAEEHIKNAGVIITGEGKIDTQTMNGKLVDAVTKLCLKHQKPVIALCGTLALPADALKASGLTAAFSIVNAPMSIDDAIENAYLLLTETAYNIGRLLSMK